MIDSHPRLDVERKEEPNANSGDVLGFGTGQRRGCGLMYFISVFYDFSTVWLCGCLEGYIFLNESKALLSFVWQSKAPLPPIQRATCSDFPRREAKGPTAISSTIVP